MNAANEIGFESLNVTTTVDVADALAKVLANTYMLALKTQNYHWNVTGPLFQALHALFETQYTDLNAATDVIAERIRALGEVAPGSYRQFDQYAEIQEETGHPSAEVMLENLLNDQKVMVKVAQSAARLAEANEDLVSADMMIGRIDVHQKAAWMLRAMLGR